MIFRLERLIYYLLLATFTIQLGKHFWPSFAFVDGIRVDYLSPTLYLSDIFAVILFLIFLVRTKKSMLSLLANKYFLLFVAVIILGLIQAVSKLAVLYGILKFLEFSFVAFYTANFVHFLGKDKKENMGNVLYVLVLGGLVQLLLIAFQFVGQESLGGIFYYLGERSFNVSTIGIAKFSFLGNDILRPYGSFPHPNVLAFYFFTVYFLLLPFFFTKKDIYRKVITVFLALFAVGIFLTFSRSVIVLFLLSNFAFLLWNKGFKSKITLVALTLLSLFGAVYFLVFAGRFWGTLINDLSLRFQLNQIATKLFLQNPILGVGLNNFFYHEIFFQKTITPILLQPVHNIYLLMLAQTGIAGLALVLLFLKKTVKTLKDKTGDYLFYKGLFIVFISILILGLVDHFFLTVQQGQLLTAFILGLCLSKVTGLVSVRPAQHRMRNRSYLSDR